MLTSGDIVLIDLGVPEGREAGFLRPAVLVTADRILSASPTVVHVVPLTSTVRRFEAEVVVEPSPDNGLEKVSAVQCQHVRSISPARISDPDISVGVVIVTDGLG